MGVVTFLATVRGAVAAADRVARKTDEAIHALRRIQMLLFVAILLLAATVATSAIFPAYAPYAYSVGAVVLAIPLIAILVLVWKPLHSHPVQVAEHWAHMLRRDKTSPSPALEQEIRRTEKRLKQVERRLAEREAVRRARRRPNAR